MEKDDIDIKQDEDTIAFEEPAQQVMKKSKKVRSRKQLDQFRKAREKRMQMIADKKKAKEDNLREEAIKRLMEDEKTFVLEVPSCLVNVRVTTEARTLEEAKKNILEDDKFDTEAEEWDGDLDWDYVARFIDDLAQEDA